MKFCIHNLRIAFFTIYMFGGFIAIAQNGNVVVAGDDFGRFSRNKPVPIRVLLNDYGLSSGIRSLEVTVKPLHGKVHSTPQNLLVYTPDFNYQGEDKFEYTVCAVDGGCGSAIVSMEVLEFDYVPILVNDTIIHVNNPKSRLEYNLLLNDKDVWDEPLTVKLLSNPKNGVAALNSNNSISLLFTKDFIGLDTLMYCVLDREGDSDTANVFIDVKAKTEVLGVYQASGISPNGDGLNDVFFIPDFKEGTHLQIKIFSQWGQLVYVNEEYLNNWNGVGNSGSMSGQELPTGTYYYSLINLDVNTQITGYIYLSR